MAQPGTRQSSFHLEGGDHAAVGQQQLNLSPTLIIGLGGTGKEVLMGVRRRFFHAYNSPTLPILANLWIDTDRRSIAEAQNIGAHSSALDLKPRDTVDAQVGGHQITHLMDTLNRHPHIDEWMDPQVWPKVQNGIHEGCGQFRPAGRLAFTVHYDTIRRRIKDALEHISSQRAIAQTQERLQHLNVQVGPTGLEVFVACSLAGGTGAGMFLDMAFLLKDVFREAAFQIRQPHVTGLLVLPGVFGDDSDLGKMKANGYAALKELEHYCADMTPVERFQERLRAEERGVAPVVSRSFMAQWKPGVPASPVPGPPFDTCYLIDNGTAQIPPRHGQDARRDLFDMVSDFIYSDFLINHFGTRKRSTRANLRQFLSRTYRSVCTDDHGRALYSRDFPTSYSAFGLAKIHVDRERLTNAAAYHLCFRVVQILAGQGDGRGRNREDADRRIRARVESGLRERGADASAILDALARSEDAALEDRIRSDLVADEREILDVADPLKAREYYGSRKKHYQAALSHTGTDHERMGSYARVPAGNEQVVLRRAIEVVHQVLSDIVFDPEGDGIVDGLRAAAAMYEHFRKASSRAREQSQKPAPGAGERKRERERLSRLTEHFEEARTLPLFSSMAADIVGEHLRDSVLRCHRLRAAQVHHYVFCRVHHHASEVFRGLLRELGQIVHDESEQGAEAMGIRAQLVSLQQRLNNLVDSLRKRYESMSTVTTNFRSVHVPREVDYERLIQAVLDPAFQSSSFRSLLESHALPQLVQDLVQEAPAPEVGVRQPPETALNKLRRYRHSDSMIPILFQRATELLAREVERAIGANLKALEKFFEEYPRRVDRCGVLSKCLENAQPWLVMAPEYTNLDQAHSPMRLVSVERPVAAEDQRRREQLIEDLDAVQRREPFDGDPADFVVDGGEDAIILYSEYGGLPIFALRQLRAWEDAYRKEVESGNGVFRHTHRDFQQFADILPAADAEAERQFHAMKSFFKGIMLGLVDWDGDSKKFYTRQPGPLGGETTFELGTHLQQVQSQLSRDFESRAGELRMLDTRIESAMRELDADHLWAHVALIRQHYADVLMGDSGGRVNEWNNAQVNCFVQIQQDFMRRLIANGECSEDSFRERAEAAAREFELDMEPVGPPGYRFARMTGFRRRRAEAPTPPKDRGAEA